MIGLVRKRHEGEGWFVFEELQNGTGGRYTGRADALALGLWPSHGFKLHGYEFKESRSDLKRELVDPQKADNLGKYCHYWWLCIRDASMMDGLTIPDTWGILVPKNGILRTLRKAPGEKKPTPIGSAFVASMIRKVSREYVPKSEHKAFVDNAKELARKEVEKDRQYKHDDAVHELKQLRDSLKIFERDSGIKLLSETGTLSSWGIGRIGDAVKAVMDAREAAMGSRFDLDPAGMVRRELHSLEHTAQQHDTAAAGVRVAADRVRELLEALKARPSPTPPMIEVPNTGAHDDA